MTSAKVWATFLENLCWFLIKLSGHTATTQFNKKLLFYFSLQ